MNDRKTVVVTGGFDPLHSGHIAYFEAARKLGDTLIVGLNSDAWLTRKKGRPFMPWSERAAIVNALSCVDMVIDYNDDDDSSCGAIGKALSFSRDTIVFANGGDRTKTNIPEIETYGDRTDVEFVFGVGGEDKKNSSSWILKEWAQPTTERAWGRYTVLDTGSGWATKNLEFYPGRALSDQRHFHRSEHWHVVEGQIHMSLEFKDGTKHNQIYNSGDSIDIPVLTWHKATNVGEITAKVIEVWMGQQLTEEDIERRD